MGNGAKAASKRERNAKDAGSVAKSQLKSVRFFFLLIQTRHAFQEKGKGVPYPVN
jgi:hypothetical protein